MKVRRDTSSITLSTGSPDQRIDTIKQGRRQASFVRRVPSKPSHATFGPQGIAFIRQHAQPANKTK